MTPIVPLSALPPRPAARARVDALLAAGATALLGACSGTLLPKPAPAPKRHTLDAATAPPAARQAPAGAPVLVMATPRAAPGHDTRRMVYRRDALELEAFAFHEWVEPPAQMLAPLLLRALQASGAFRAVLLSPSTAAGAWLLETELVSLMQDFSTQPSQVRLSLRAVMLTGRTRQPIAWREFAESVAATRDDPVAGVQAAHEAARQLLAALASFCSEHALRSPGAMP